MSPSPQQLLLTLRAALAAEQALDRTHNLHRALDRPARVRHAAPQTDGTTILRLERGIRLEPGDDVVLSGSGGQRSAVVREAVRDTLVVVGFHADAHSVSGRPMQLAPRLSEALTRAFTSPSNVLRAAGGWAAGRLDRRRPPLDTLLDGLERDQADVLERSLGSELLLVLGPPGTGKTETLARTVAGLLLSGERVLLLAPTHAAVDTALGRIRQAALGFDIPAAALLRQGRHRVTWRGPALDGTHRTGIDEALAGLELRGERLGHGEWDWVRGVAGAFRTAPGPSVRLDRLEARAQEVLRRDGDRVDARALLREVRELRRSAAAASTPPRLVGATLAEALIRPPEGPWDAVVVDEAAMAHIPYALWSASLARRRLLLWGDPHQLGPVCPVHDPGARRVLARSLFHHLDCARAATEDPRRPVLRVQHRMAPPIRELVSTTFYEGVLQDGTGAAARAGAVEVIDSAGLARDRDVGGSRANDTHARMAAARVERLRSQGIRSVAVVTPYRAQVDVLRRAIAQRAPDLESAGGLVGTVHSAQGGEYEAVIVDLVATRNRHAGFLDERLNPEASSLLCVALSRARTTLTVIADVAALPANGIARAALARAVRARAA